MILLNCFLLMVRKTLCERGIDTELAYAYANTDLLHGVEDFLPLTNIADILEVREKCFEDELCQAAKLAFTSISNWPRPLFPSGRIKPLWKVLGRPGIHSAYISAKRCLF